MTAPEDGPVGAVVPAAGRGSRLGAGRPKVVVPVAGGLTVWHLLHRTLAPYADRVHVVVSPAGEPAFRALLATDEAFAGVTVGVQQRPTGMGDAVFGAEPAWAACSTLLVVWGDQVNLSPDTVRRTLAAHRAGTGPRLTVPLARQPTPYVEYVFDPDRPERLREVRQSREGDACTPGGRADVGCFALSTAGLVPAWDDFVATAARGTSTGEVNFLPFLAHLSDRGWPVTPVEVPDADESRGVNTPEDLAFAAARLAGRRS